MNPAKINALLDILSAACSRQFGFNPRRISAGMRYSGTEGHGASQVHIFRDTHSNSQIELKGTFATLRQQHGDKPHWTETEMSHYRNTDAEIDADIAAKNAKLAFIRNCALYLEHREQLLSLYKDWPTHQPGGPTPREAARTLIVALTAAHDARLADFAEQMRTNDLEQLAHLLLAPCHLEIEERAAAKKV